MSREGDPKRLLANIECIAAARHFLFVPGNRPERFDKADASDAHVVILDLEDAVPPDAKVEARQHVRKWLEGGGRAMVRINAGDTPFFDDDFSLLNAPNLVGIMLPKAADGRELHAVASRVATVPLIETALGLATMSHVAQTPGVVRLALGAIDLALDLDILPTESQLDPVRLAMTVASRCADIAAPVDGVSLDFRNEELIAAATRAARALGFKAKLCIHPDQIACVENALRPSSAEIEQARLIVEADKMASGSAVSLDGKMVDRPVVAQAYRLLESLKGD